LRKMVLTMLAGMALTAQAACSRTDDGSVTVARPLDVGRFWKRDPAPPATPPVQSGLQVFPTTPAPSVTRSRGSVSPRKSRRRASAPPPQVPAKPLACRDAVNSSGRIHVVCE
jgi:hypothetical protein